MRGPPAAPDIRHGAGRNRAITAMQCRHATLRSAQPRGDDRKGSVAVRGIVDALTGSTRERGDAIERTERSRTPTCVRDPRNVMRVRQGNRTARKRTFRPAVDRSVRPCTVWVWRRPAQPARDAPPGIDAHVRATYAAWARKRKTPDARVACASTPIRTAVIANLFPVHDGNGAEVARACGWRRAGW